MNFILSLIKRAFGGSSDIDGIVAPMRKIVAKLDAHSAHATALATEKEDRAVAMLSEVSAHNTDAKRAATLSAQYGKLIGV